MIPIDKENKMDTSIQKGTQFDDIDSFEIEPLSDEALELVAGGKSSDGPSCCSCSNCCNC